MPNELGRILRRFGGRTRRLGEGEYDLTPPIWTKHVYQYTLTVSESGFGILRLIPRYPDSHSGLLDHEGLGDSRAGGRLMRIPEDQPVALVTGPNKFNPNICLYEMVWYVPDLKI